MRIVAILAVLVLGSVALAQTEERQVFVCPAGPEIVGTGGHAFAVINGLPAIAYKAVTNSIQYAPRTGGTWNSSPAVTSPPGNLSSHLALAEVAGQPAIAYLLRDATNFYLWHAYFDGESWQSEQVYRIGNQNSGEVLPSIAEVDGQSAIAFTAGSRLIFAKYDGTRWVLQTVETGKEKGKKRWKEKVSGLFVDAGGRVVKVPGCPDRHGSRSPA